MATPMCFSLITRSGFRAAGFVILMILAVLASLSGARQLSSPLPIAPGAKIVALNRRAGFSTEPSIAVNPQKPSQILTAFQVPASVAYSEDSGGNWEFPTGTAPENYKMSGDVSVAYDILGHAILCYFAFDKLGTTKYWAHNATRNGIFVRRSLDGGKTWEANAVPVDEQATRPEMLFEDKPYLIADDNPNSPYAGSLYVGWTEFSLTKSVILFSRSKDGGITWSAPFEISSHEGLPRDDNGSVEGFAAAAAPNGLLYAIWADGDSIALATSRDGGITFTPSRKILDVAPPYFKVDYVDRSNGFPQIGIDPRTGKVFVTWSDYRDGDADIFCITSPDRGRNWSRPVRVNSDPLHNGADQFLQWLAIDPVDGAANIVFYDRRDDPGNRRAAVFLARSTDGGQTFANYAWETPFDPESAFLGDHTGLTAFDGRVYGAWTEPAATSRNTMWQLHATGKPPTVVKIGIADFKSPAAR
jgi:hypothetical protein